jgi:hypothetical protein
MNPHDNLAWQESASDAAIELGTAGDEDFSDLEALINPKPLPDADEPDEGFDELEELLGEAMDAQREITRVKELRKKQKGGFGLSAEDEARIRAWELAREWTAVANCAIFKRYECACGYHSTVFEGLMLEQKHRHDKHANRWTAQETSVAALPNNTAIRTKPIPMCQRCANSKGFSLVTDLQWRDS